jgi:hypothetical protein
VVLIAAWFVPGLGHLLLRRWGRAAAFFLAVGSLALGGIMLRGYVFPPQPKDAFEFLGLLADLGAGAYYFLAWVLQNEGPDISQATGDYGTRFFATAGVLNLLCLLDVHALLASRRD